MSTRKRLLPWFVFLALVAMFVLAYVNRRAQPGTTTSNGRSVVRQEPV